MLTEFVAVHSIYVSSGHEYFVMFLKSNWIVLLNGAQSSSKRTNSGNIIKTIHT